MRNHPETMLPNYREINVSCLMLKSLRALVKKAIVSELEPSELDAIGIVDNHLELLLVDPVGWEEEIEAVHLEILQEKLTITFTSSKASNMWRDMAISLIRKSSISPSNILHRITA